MHFTFIALTPIVDVAFLSYQYKIFACECNGKAELMAPGEGRALLADHTQQTSPCFQTAAAPQRNSAEGLQDLDQTLCTDVMKEPCRMSDVTRKRQTSLWKWEGKGSTFGLWPTSKVTPCLRFTVPRGDTCTAHLGDVLSKNAGPRHSLRGEVAWWDAARWIARGYGSAVSCSWGKPAWCSQSHPFGRGTCSQEGSAGATRSGDGFPALSRGSFTARPDQNFLPSCFPTTPPASAVAVAKPSPLLP